MEEGNSFFDWIKSLCSSAIGLAIVFGLGMFMFWVVLQLFNGGKL